MEVLEYLKTDKFLRDVGIHNKVQLGAEPCELVVSLEDVKKLLNLAYAEGERSTAIIMCLEHPTKENLELYRYLGDKVTECIKEIEK